MICTSRYSLTLLSQKCLHSHKFPTRLLVAQFRMTVSGEVWCLMPQYGKLCKPSTHFHVSILQQIMILRLATNTWTQTCWENELISVANQGASLKETNSVCYCLQFRLWSTWLKTLLVFKRFHNSVGMIFHQVFMSYLLIIESIWSHDCIACILDPCICMHSGKCLC